MNELVVIHWVRTSGEPVEYYPGLYCYQTLPKVDITKNGRRFLNDVATRLNKRTMNEQQVVDLLNETAEEIDSSLRYEISDKFFSELYKIL